VLSALILHIRHNREDPMAENNSGPEEGIKGVVEDVKGKAKEAVGTVTGRSDLTEEGKAQQDKADAQRDAAAKEAEAEKARGEAKTEEQRQKSH
jgi:uncharacterized protein YjbJ (UPF0337 family)